MSQRTVLAAIFAVLALCVCAARATIFFHDEFNTLDGWETSQHKSDYGKVQLSAGQAHVNAKAEQGLQLAENAKFYAVSKKLPTPVDNDGKSLVISYSVKHDESLDCGGAYLKFFSELDQKDFHGESPYWLMFGPDKCGSTNRLHIILSRSGENHLWKQNFRPTADRVTHVYTLEIAPNNSYQVYVDGEYKVGGSLEEDWDIVEPKTIADPDEQKPADWVDDPMMDDPSDVKPADWDDQPAMINDAEAQKPEDWDDEEDGEWEAPTIPNAHYHGEWKARQIENPAYKGAWVPQQIPNPKYAPEPNLYKVPAPLQYVGIDVWQVQGRSIFDNLIIGDDLEEVLKLVKSTYGSIAAKEKELVEAVVAKEMAATKAAVEGGAKPAKVAEALKADRHEEQSEGIEEKQVEGIEKEQVEGDDEEDL